MKTERTTLTKVLEQVEAALREAVTAKENGIAYMYVCGTKCLSVSVEGIDLNDSDKQANKEETK